MDIIKKTISVLLRDYLKVQADEAITFLGHEKHSELLEVAWKAGKRLTKNVLCVKYSEANLTAPQNGFIKSICEPLLTSKTSIFFANDSLDETHFSDALLQNSRIIIIQNISALLKGNFLISDSKRIVRKSRKLADLFTIGKTFSLSSPSGTDIQIDISKSNGVAHTGIPGEPSQIVLLPSGAASINLTKSSLNGKIILDRIAGISKKLNTPITLYVNNNQISQIKGATEAEALRKSLRKFGKNGRTITQMGVGTNDFIKLGYSDSEDEKHAGSVYFILGENQVTKIHGKMLKAVKGLLLKPTLSVDGKLLVQDGKILV